MAFIDPGASGPLPQITDRKTELENIIKSGNFSASQAREYNQLTGSNRGARDVAISTPTSNVQLNTTYDQTDYNVWNKSKGNTGVITDPGSSPLPEVTGIDSKGNSIYGGVNDITKNNKTINGGTTTNTGGTTTKEKTPLELAQEQISKQQAEIERKNKEYEILQNKGAESELTAGVIPGMSGKGEQTDFFKGISDTMSINYQTELANLEKAKQDLQKQIEGTGLTAEGQKQVLAPYDQFLNKITALKDLNKQASQREQEDLKNRYNQTIDRQRKANDLARINAEKIAAITGVGFTSGGIQGINNIIEEGNQAITDLEGQRESMLSKYQDADKQLDIEYLDTITTVQNKSQEALQNAYNSVITQIQALDTAKSKASKEYLEGVRGIAKDYFDVLNKQWEQDFKVMDFNYKKYIDYKKDVRDQEAITREQNKQTLDLITKGDLTGLTDEDIMTIGDDMGLDNGTIKGLILQREQQKSDKAKEEAKMKLEERKLNEMTPYQKAQYEMDVKKYGLDVAKQRLDERKFTAEQGGGETPITSGVLTTENIGGKNITMDTNAMNSFKNAIANMPGAVIGAQQYRTPEEQADLVKKGVSWTYDSKHMKGLAVDIYANNKLEKPTKEQIATMNANGWYQPEETMAKGDYGHFEYRGSLGAPKTTKDFTDGEISLFNSAKYNPQTDKDKKRVARYEEYQNVIAELASNPNADITELMRNSKGGKDLGQSENKAYKDIGIVVSQLGGLKTAIDKYKEDQWSDSFSPITGLIASKNPWDTKAQDIKARLQALVPKVARGVMGEVGVLTDQDIANYIQTLPNIKQTAEVQDVIQLALLGTVKASLDNAVRTDQATFDVSKLVGNYKQLSNKIKELENKVVLQKTEKEVIKETTPATGVDLTNAIRKRLEK